MRLKFLEFMVKNIDNTELLYQNFVLKINAKQNKKKTTYTINNTIRIRFFILSNQIKQQKHQNNLSIKLRKIREISNLLFFCQINSFE
jgi:hypothetical protein